MESQAADHFIDNYADTVTSIVYTSENTPGPGCNLDMLETQICNSCTCSTDDCTVESACSCISLSHGRNYENLSKNTLRVKILCDDKLGPRNESSYSIFECNDLCSCSASACPNRIVQFGPRKSLFIQNDSKKGSCLFTDYLIIKGEFICEYAGELISKDEARRRFKADLKEGKMNYIFILREFFANDHLETIVDPSYIGNIGRFINHSCNPNATIVPVRVESVIPKLAIFALSDIEANTEITMSYSTVISSTTDDTLQGRKPCHCGEDNCTKFLPFDADI